MAADSIPNWLIEEDALSHNRTLLRYTALLPGVTMSEIRWRRYVRMIMYFTMCTMTIGAFVEAYNTRSSFMGIIECGTVCITQLKCLLKLAIIIIHEKEVRYLFDKMTTNFYIHENVFKDKIISTIKSKKKAAFWISMPYISLFMFTIVLIAMDKSSSLLNRPPKRFDTNETVEFKRILPLRIWLPINEQLSPNYEIGYFYQEIIFTYEIFSTTVIDTFIAVIIMCVSTQFQLLGTSIENASQNVTQLLQTKVKNASSREGPDFKLCKNPKHGKFTTATFKEKESIPADVIGPSLLDNGHKDAAHKFSNSLEWRREMDKYLGLCIQRHQALLEYMEHLTIISSPIELIQALTSSLLICTCLFTAISTGNPAILPRVILYAIDALIQIGLPCYYATQLQIQSMNIAEAAYNCEWYDEPVSFQKSIGMMIMRAQKPVCIYLGPFGVMSLELFATVVQSAYSYLTLLRQVHE